ncbi:MAG: menaquinol oxidoreductase [Syntrophaceae bacterium CG2_30_49_12]|nr:MAG: menaquinol oxidoreductase [Syntrophaceae bacterium CG2_30_49_12]PIP08386.1 MAG: menaquinol oxidoreductase [Syntrophobacterales bacterium CG23_combo_of_CG06-09_8_20_14_all_48_27]PJA49162.1 MAG: menaquinol oxidoreductase [Syntrophobacterales bacterium CG_4_9_14_3_um_filter_49_8]PJC74885.1 MAG: menaquinol oxidoreductase [Syntrophobacterales bacterium CG_4_8_14_3_um_filter_49_14]
MGLWFSLFAVVILTFVVFMGVEMGKLHFLFGLVVPYAAFATFIVGVISRVVGWARSPVPFRITTTCGQQKSLPWIKADNIESPHNTLGVIARMALEVLLFRSLFRNTKVELKNDPRLVYGGAKWLWLAGLAFHWSFLVILIRHLRFFTEPVPRLLGLFAGIDGVFEIGVPVLYISGLIMLVSVTYLFLRRVFIPQVRYISLAADYFPLFLIIGVGLSGLLMRHFFKVDIFKVKELAMGLVSFHPLIPEGIGIPFYIHLFLVSVLLAYFPFSKLMHLGGVFLSPTRNLANNNRMKRHVNPWNYPVKVHTYEEYEDEFRDKMKAAGIPVEKE